MTLSELTRLATLHKVAKYPNVPLHAIVPVKAFKDGTANELTRAIETFIRLTGNYADRINNTGIYDTRTGKWRKGGTRKGIADIMASKKVEHGGRTFSITVAIEVKIGRDRLSEHQKRCKEEIERSGGVYIIAKEWDGFFAEWNAIK